MSAQNIPLLQGYEGNNVISAPAHLDKNGEIPHTQPSIGRRRRASVITRLIGHSTFSRNLPALITAIITFESNPGIENLRRTLLERLSLIPRFRSKLVLSTRKGGYFEEVPIDVGYHFEVFGFGEKVTREQMNQHVEQVQKWNCDYSKPLWKVIHVPEMDDGTSIAVVVVDHAIGDGISLVDVLMGLTDETDPEKKKSGTITRRAKAPPLPFFHRANAFTQGIVEGLTITVKKRDKENPLKSNQPVGKEKKIASSPGSIDLKQVKEICAKMEGKFITVNDVIMAILTKTFAKYYLQESSVDPKKLKIRAQFPLNLRKKTQSIRNADGDPCNNFAYGYFPLPLTVHDKGEDLLMKIKMQVDYIKHSPAPKVGKSSLPVHINIMPVMTLLKLLENVNNLATVMISNVPGPQHQVTLAGKAILDFQFFLFTVIGLYVGVFSYNGKLSFSVNMDTTNPGNPKALADLFVPSFEELYKEICGGGAMQEEQDVVEAKKPAPAEAAV